MNTREYIRQTNENRKRIENWQRANRGVYRPQTVSNAIDKLAQTLNARRLK